MFRVSTAQALEDFAKVMMQATHFQLQVDLIPNSFLSVVLGPPGRDPSFLQKIKQLECH